ncbi:hypothetical protein MASR1M90_07190 [Desulfovibrionales bacterium]
MNTTFRDILDVFFRYLYHMIIFSIIIVAVTLVYMYGTKKIYTSNAQVLIRLGQEQMGSMQFMSNARNVYITRREQELKNEEMIFLSDQVITAAATEILGDDKQDVKILTAVKKYLTTNLEVKTLFESDTLSISFKFPDPHVAQKILEILVQKYIEHHLDVYENTRELHFVKLKLDESRKNYDDALKKYTDFIESAQIYDEKQVTFLLEKSNAMRTELSNLKAEHEYHVQKLASAKKELKLLQPYEKYNSIEVLNDRRSKLQSKLNEAYLEKQNLLQKYTPESRLVLDADKEIQTLQKLIRSESERIVDSVDNRKNEIYGALSQTVIDLQTTIAGEQGKIASLTQELKELEDTLSRNAREYQYVALLKKDLDLAKTAYEKYYEGYLESDLSNVSRLQHITNISIIDKPSITTLPTWPNKKKLLFFAGAFLIAGNVFLVILLIMLNNTVGNPADLVKQFGKQPLATISLALHADAGGQTQAPVTHDGTCASDCFVYYKNNLKEFQKLYINLSIAGENEKTYLIGRSLPGEGGATVTLNLAAFMAEYLDKKVAIVDYYPSCMTGMMQNFNPTTTDGFEMTVFGKIDCYRCMHEKVFSPEKIREKYAQLEKLRNSYDYIFCNIQPVKDFADLVFLNKYIDRVLFIVEAERTKLHVVKYNINTLEQYGFSEISFILNKRRFYIPKFLYNYV